jgi:hypothetical protein
MEMTFSQYRIIIEVFRSFGILITGKGKYKSFYYDLSVSQLYIQALLFELELRLGIYLDEETVEGLCCPQSIVSALSEHKKAGMIHPSADFNLEKNMSLV